MKKYERLTDKKYLNKPKCFNCEHNYSNCSTCERHCVDGDCFQLREELQRLVQLEDKIENGTLIELPCRVGDTIYQVIKNTIVEWSVYRIDYFVLGANGFDYCLYGDSYYLGELERFYEQDIGNIVFLTKAEAEANLREIEFNKRIDCGNSAIIED